MITRFEKWTHMHVIFWCQNTDHKKYHLNTSFELIFIWFFHLLLQLWNFSSWISLERINLNLLITEFSSPFLNRKKRKRDIVMTYSERSSTEVYHDTNEDTFNSAKISSVYGCPPFCVMTELTRERSFPTCSVLLASSLVLLSKSTHLLSHSWRIS